MTGWKSDLCFEDEFEKSDAIKIRPNENKGVRSMVGKKSIYTGYAECSEGL